MGTGQPVLSEGGGGKEANSSNSPEDLERFPSLDLRKDSGG